MIEDKECRRDVGDPLAAILDEAPLQQRADRLRHVGRQRVPVRFESNDRAEHVGHVLAIKCAPAGQHLVQHAAERPYIAALVSLASLRLLRRHVRGRAENDAHAGHHRGRGDRGRRRDVSVARRGLGLHEFREAEVEHLHDTVGRDLDVRRFQIAMNDPVFVRRFEGVADLTRDRQGFIQRNCTTRDAIR